MSDPSDNNSNNNNSNNNNNEACYHVVQEATELNPWAVGVIGALPTSLAESSSGSSSITARAWQCVRDGPWSALLVPPPITLEKEEEDRKTKATTEESSSAATQSAATATQSSSFQVHVCYTNASQSMAHQKFETGVTTVTLPVLPSMSTSVSDAATMKTKPWIALQQAATSAHPSTSSTSSSSSSMAAFLYVLTGPMLCCYKINAPPPSSAATAAAAHGAGHSHSSSNRHTTPPMVTPLPSFDETTDTVTTMAAASSLAGSTSSHNYNSNALYLGTATGRVWRIQPRPATNSLQVQDMTALQLQQQQAAAASRGTRLFQSLFSSSAATGVGTEGHPTQPYEWKLGSPLVQVLPAVSPTVGVWTATADKVQLWQANNTSSSSSSVKLDFTLGPPLFVSSSPQGSSTTTSRKKMKHSIVAVAQATPHVLHVLVVTSNVQNEGDQEPKKWYSMRWQYNDSATESSSSSEKTWKLVRTTWLNRLAASAQCLGWQASQNGMAIGAFLPQTDNNHDNGAVVLAVVPSSHRNANDDVYEYDCDHDDPLLPNSFQADYATHGVTFGSRSGVWMRAQCKAAVNSSTNDSLNVASSSASMSSIRGGRRLHAWDERKLVTQLLHHLKASFQIFVRTAAGASRLELPPSWNTPEAAEKRDQVVLLLAREHLPPLGGHSLHRAFINFLQQVGLYRSLQPLTRWNLMAIGQEIDAYEALPRELIPDHYFQALVENKTNLATWIEVYQLKVVVKSESADILDEWTQALSACLGAAMRFKAERATFPYDVGAIPRVQSREQVPLWLARGDLQRALLEWLKVQNQRHDEKSGWNWTPAKETVLLAALDSFAASYQALPTDESVRMDYAQAQAMAMPLLYDSQETQELAWSLAQEHLCFGGLCELAKMHEKETGTPFALEPLFGSLGNKVDVQTGMTFGAFCLKWHLRRKLFGHALEYGKFCPMDLHKLVDKEPEFEQFRWIAAIRDGDFEAATKSLIKNTMQGPTSVGQCKIHMGLADISNSIAREEVGTPQQRKREIEKMRERANVQEQLLGETEDTRSKPLWTAERLLKYALQQLDRQESLRDKIRTCFQALAACTTFDSMDDAREGAVRVWSEALQDDLNFLKQFVFKSANIDMEAVYERTVLGGLYREVSTIDTWKEVHLNASIAERMLAGMASEDRAAVNRLLRDMSSN